MGDKFYDLQGLDGILRVDDFIAVEHPSGGWLFGRVTKAASYAVGQLALIHLPGDSFLAIQTPCDRWRHAIGPSGNPFQPAHSGHKEK